jgi:molybdopterin converting factor small subunit
MKVLIPSPLRDYTKGQRWVEAEGGTLGSVLDDLDRRHPGIRFRMIDEQETMRRHVRFFVNGAQTFDLGLPLRESDELCIVQALSGG